MSKKRIIQGQEAKRVFRVTNQMLPVVMELEPATKKILTRMMEVIPNLVMSVVKMKRFQVTVKMQKLMTF